MVEQAKETAKDPGYYSTAQFNNRDALVGYEAIGRELLEQIPSGIDAFCGTVSGAGMVMGSSKVLKSKWPHVHVVVLEPASSPVITERRTGTHGVEGIGIGFRPPHLDDSLYDEARAVPEADVPSSCKGRRAPSEHFYRYECCRGSGSREAFGAREEGGHCGV